MLQNDINYEFVFVNDGSTDRTMEILSEIAANDYRTKSLTSLVTLVTK